MIIDGHHLMYRAFYAIPRTMKTKSGEQVNTVFGVCSMIIEILKREEPDALLLCFDADEKTFRHLEYADYKAGRAETPDDFFTQIPRVMELLEVLGLSSVSGGTYEADDYACAYAKEAAKNDTKVTIVTGDRDLLQLVNDRIIVAIPHKGYQGVEYMGEKEVIAKFGVRPNQIPAYKGLVGDASDNLPGVKGIGPIAGASLLQTYGTLDAVYQHLSEIKDSWRIKLAQDKDKAYSCERLATLVSNFSLPVPLEKTLLEPRSPEALLSFFDALNFTLLRKRFDAFQQTSYGQKYFPFNPQKQQNSSKEVEQMTLVF